MSTTHKEPLLGYVPSAALAAVGAALFLVLFVASVFQLVKHGRKYMLILPIGLLTMAAGFLIRIARHVDEGQSVGIYTAETLFILLSPCAYLATDYMLLRRLALGLGDDVAAECLIIPPRHLTKIFVTSDILTFLIQGAGGGMSINNPNLGKVLSMTGLALQLISLLAYVGVTVVFSLRVRSRFPQHWSSLGSSRSLTDKSRWKVLLFTILATCVGLVIRSVFRIAEYVDGYASYLATTEAYFYLLDSLPLWLAMALFCFLVWPPRYLEAMQGSERISSPAFETLAMKNRDAEAGRGSA